MSKPRNSIRACLLTLHGADHLFEYQAKATPWPGIRYAP